MKNKATEVFNDWAQNGKDEGMKKTDNGPGLKQRFLEPHIDQGFDQSQRKIIGSV